MNIIIKFFVNRELDKIQAEISAEYKENGLTEELLDKQVLINSIRNLFDIPDDAEKIYKKYTQ